MPGIDKYTSLCLHVNGLDGGLSTEDSSAFKHSVSFEGNAELDTAQFKFDGSSFLGDGFANLSIPRHPSLILGTGDFVLECWVRWSTLTGHMFHAGFESTDLNFSMQGDGQIYIPNFLVGTDFVFSTNTWYHVAWVRSSGTSRILINGVVESDVVADTTNYTCGEECAIGARPDGGQGIVGWMDEVRISKGTDRGWASGFTPPTAPYDTLPVGGVDIYTTGAWPFDGVDTATTFPDISQGQHRLVANGTAQIDTGQSVFGGASAQFAADGGLFNKRFDDNIVAWWSGDYNISGQIRDESRNGHDMDLQGDADVTTGHIGLGAIILDGTGDFASLADHDDFSFTDGAGNDDPFSICGWFFVDDVTTGAIQALVSKWSAANGEWIFYVGQTGLLTLQLIDADSGPSWIGRSFQLVDLTHGGQWIHVAATYSGNNASSGIKLYVNGVRVDTDNVQDGSYGGMVNAGDDIQIGAADGTFLLDGRFDDVFVYAGELTAAQVAVIAADQRLMMTFGTGDFVVDFRLRLSTSSGVQIIFDLTRDHSTDRGILFYATEVSVTEVALIMHNNGTKIDSGGGVNINTFYHVALVRSSGVTRLFINGVQFGSNFNDTNDYYADANAPVLGAHANDLSGFAFTGHIDMFRVTKGNDRGWSQGFTVPSAAYEADALGLISGLGEVSGVGIADAEGVGDSDGIAVVTGIGFAGVEGVFSSAGIATAQAEGTAIGGGNWAAETPVSDGWTPEASI